MDIVASASVCIPKNPLVDTDTAELSEWAHESALFCLS